MSSTYRQPSDEFISEYGRFKVYGVERIEGPKLREMFLPRMSREGQKALDRHSRSFVRAQLKHYGVEVDESKYSGNGTNLLKNALKAGKCDRVPDDIAKLEKELHAKWLDQQSPQTLSDEPKWAMEKYFLTDGNPDRQKTASVIGIPFDRSSEYRSGKMIDAAKNVDGLHHKRVFGPENQVIFLGWIEEEVEKAASKYLKEKPTPLKDARLFKRRTARMGYLKSRSKGKSDDTPVGSYVVECRKIEDGWPDLADDMDIEIHTTDTPGVFQGDFDFGIAKGVMFLCSKRSTLAEYCSRAERDSERGGYDSESLDEEEEDTGEEYLDSSKGGFKRGTKRGSRTSKNTEKAKKPRAEQGQPLKFLLQMKSHETSEGQIDFEAREGMVEFDDERFVSFSGDATMIHGVGGFLFFAHKVSDVPRPSGENWSNYSEREYQRQASSRWR